MGANQRTTATTYSNLGAYQGENIGTGHGTPAQNDSTWTSTYRPQANMTQILWNAGFSTNAQWSDGDGTAQGVDGGPGGAGNGPGIGGSNANLAGTFATVAGTGATASATISIANVISIAVTAGGSEYGSVPAVTISGGSGAGATATAVLTDGVVTSITMTSQGSGYSSMDSLTVTIASPGTPNILVNANSVTFTQTTGHSNYFYQPTTASDGIPIDGQIVLGGGTGFGGETPYDADGTTDNFARLYIKYVATGSSPDTNDYLTVKVGTYYNDGTFGTFKLHADQVVAAIGGGFSDDPHGNVSGSSGSNQYWTAFIPDLDKFKGEPVTIAADDGSGAGATGYIVTSNTSTGAVASVVITGAGTGFVEAGEACTVTGTASGKTSCKGTCTINGSGGITALTVTTAGVDYKSGRLYITIGANGNTGRAYNIKQCELYVANQWDNSRGKGHAEYDTLGVDSDGNSGITFTRSPSGRINPGKTASTAASKYNISGDFVDVAKVTTPIWDFTYVQGDGMQTDATSSSSTYASSSVYHKYPVAVDVGNKTIRTTAYINNTAPAGTHASDYFGIGAQTIYIEEINQTLKPFAAIGAAREDTRVEASGAVKVNALGQWQNGDQAVNPFFIYDKLSYRIETTEPITEFYIDWDDGEDNSPEKANYQLIKLEEPTFFATAEHVYTTHGSHYPVIRAKSVDGYLSKYYTAYEDQGTLIGTTTTEGVSSTEGDTNYDRIYLTSRVGLEAGSYILVDEEYIQVKTTPSATSAGVVNITDGRGALGSEISAHTLGSSVYNAAGSNQNDFSALESSKLTHGQNEFSMVSVDHISTHKLPVFRPANKPPIAILKTDRSRVLSGIQNELFSTSGALAPHTVHIDASANSSTGADSAKVKITYETYSTSGDDQQILSATKYDTQTIPNVSKILKVELINLKEVKTTTNYALKAGERVYIRKTNASGDVFCYVSLGNPIVKENDHMNIAVLDVSESRTRASNVTIDSYFIDDGHHITGSSRHNPVSTALQEAATTAATLQTGDTLVSGFKTYYPSISTQYSFQSKLDPIDTDGRYLPREILCRAQVKDSSSTTRTDTSGGDTIEYSYLDHDMYTGYNPTTPPRPSVIKSSNLLLGTLDRDTPNWTDLSTLNRSSTKSSAEFILGGGHTSTTARTPTAGAAHTDKAENYMLMTRVDKFDRIFIKTYNNYTANPPTMSGTTTLPEYRISLYYPSKDSTGTIVWKPLPFSDSTKYENVADSSLMKDGSIMFKPPSDWEKTKSASIHADEWLFGEAFTADSSGTDGPVDKWTVDSYGIMICIATKYNHANKANLGISFMRPYSNAHSQILTLLDPTHVSLNNRAIAQGISFSRNGQYSQLTSRLGKTEIRKISARSGKVTFGGVDLGDATRKEMKEYQQNSTPVYLDVEHKNGDFTRFFGVLDSMSENHTTGGMTPKFGLNLTVSHIIEFDSTGTILSNDYISLGGNVDYESQYIQ